MTTDPFTDAARAEAERRWTRLPKQSGNTLRVGTRFGFMVGAGWAQRYLTAQEPDTAERVRAWAVRQYPSGTPLDQDRRMVAAETEAYLSGRSGRETSELSEAAKNAGPIDPPAAQEPTDAEVIAALGAANRTTLTGSRFDAPLSFYSDNVVEAMRAALSAARAARRDEEKRDD